MGRRIHIFEIVSLSLRCDHISSYTKEAMVSIAIVMHVTVYVLSKEIICKIIFNVITQHHISLSS